jgi:CheY-like chemotaxis protein
MVEYTLDWASTYEEGWAMIQAGDYDAVLMDYDLGPKNGLDLIRRAVNNQCRFPIILFTGRGSYEVDHASDAVWSSALPDKRMRSIHCSWNAASAMPSNESRMSKPYPPSMKLYPKRTRFYQNKSRSWTGVYQEHSHILESIQDGFFSIDRNWKITYINRKSGS